MKKTLLGTILVLALIGSMVTPSFAGRASAASHTQSHPAFLDKTRFLLHMGLAYFAFHHFIYAKYKAGDFKSGAKGRTGNIVKAAIAALFAYHELKVAYGIAQKSNSGILHTIIKPLDALQSGFSSVADHWKKGQYSDSDVQSLDSKTSGLSSILSKGGYSVKDIPVSIPGA